MSITTFPPELLIHIFSFLPWQDHLTACEVNALWSTLILSNPTKPLRYTPATPLYPQIHNLFLSIGLECTINIFTGQVSKIIFLRNETEGSLRNDQDRAKATIDLTNSQILKEGLLNFQGWRYERDIRRKDWKMGVCIMWNQLGYEYGGQKDRQIYRQDWFSFVGNGDEEEEEEEEEEEKEKEKEEKEDLESDILRGEVDLDISVGGFIEVLGKHVLKFDSLKIAGKQDMRLRLGMYDKMGIVFIRKVREVSKIFDLAVDPLDGIFVDKDRTWINE
ncbi:hypothetical protein TWF106_002145 [Orbilia oligospora]|uniref:F-box domain-containing protein n=2 Tax=Orbilia oligospora TaxID=2813651 RepID=A0A6G1M2R0_ORBOL|nr:hypothetical protein TWF679_010890 [Orbilia oligospora]KAF3225627.1 hypothetical protein TWF106_002145 [Orbilia oligospora]KAF3226225.1 hypothetical protein TWF191_004886 [Orbilia oligospora]KAF3241830.1 hypothetical protein TWF192_008843 [Orbilia oligospora]